MTILGEDVNFLLTRNPLLLSLVVRTSDYDAKSNVGTVGRLVRDFWTKYEFLAARRSLRLL